MTKKLFLHEKRFGRLTAKEMTVKRDYKGSVIWKCVCDCGVNVEVSADRLMSGNTTSCGCRKKEIQQSVGDHLTFVDGTCIDWLESRKSRCDNTSGFRGVYKYKDKWRVMIGFKGKRYYCGIFNTFEEAKLMRIDVEKCLHEDFIHAWKKWKQIADTDTEWANENPFKFEVAQKEGVISVYTPFLNDSVPKIK